MSRTRSSAATFPQLEDKGGLAKNQEALRYFMIDRYWKCLPQSQWDPEPNQAQKVVVLPNRNSIDQYKRSAQDTMQKVAAAVNELAADDEKFAVYKDRVEAVAQESHRSAEYALSG